MFFRRIGRSLVLDILAYIMMIEARTVVSYHNAQEGKEYSGSISYHMEMLEIAASLYDHVNTDSGYKEA